MPTGRDRSLWRDDTDSSPRGETPLSGVQDLQNQSGPKRVNLVEIVRHEGPILLPNGLSYQDAANLLIRKRDEEEETRMLTATIKASPYDGAYALSRALEQMFGFKVGGRCPNCGNNHNRDIQVQVDARGGIVTVPWGIFHVPGVEGSFYTGSTEERGHTVFQIHAEVKGKYAQVFNDLVTLTRKLVAESSIYRGKALSIQFTDEDSEQLEIPEVEFVDVSSAIKPIFSVWLEEQLDNDILSYLTIPEAIKRHKGTLKRGVLLTGPYGTGKTLTAAYMARVAMEQGFTFIYVKPEDIPHAHRFARTAYQPAVIFAEDVESVAGHTRDEEVNQLLNILDGVDGKKNDIIVVCTTNHPEKINEAFLRPGRFDVVMNIATPDAEAAIRLASHYTHGQMEEGDYVEAGQALGGLIPAVIAEAVDRATIRALKRTNGGSTLINNTDLVGAAHSIRNERAKIEPKREKDAIERHGEAIGRSLAETAVMIDERRFTERHLEMAAAAVNNSRES